MTAYAPTAFYGPAECRLSQGLLDACVNGWATPAALLEWGRTRQGGTPKCAEREELLAAWGGTPRRPER
ncbi:hypothetical protein ACFRFL_09440 [Streptomyces sp. NPDC056708]|uniref:hypothetical protein n=1 Tax=unclassified Streptomyces TaxID=2593676 RepID=UPI0036935E56